MASDRPCEGLCLYLAGKQVPAIVPAPSGTAMPLVPRPESSLAACDTKGQKGDGVTLKPAPQLLLCTGQMAVGFPWRRRGGK